MGSHSIELGLTFSVSLGDQFVYEVPHPRVHCTQLSLIPWLFEQRRLVVNFLFSVNCLHHCGPNSAHQEHTVSRHLELLKLIRLRLLALRLHVRKHLVVERRQCETKTSASGTKLQNHHSTASTTPECRIRLTGCLSLHTFRPGSRPKVDCLFFSSRLFSAIRSRRAVYWAASIRHANVRLRRHNTGSCARLCHWPKCWNRACATSLLVQSCRGYLSVRAPVGFQSNTRLTHRFGGKFATCIANCQLWRPARCVKNFLTSTIPNLGQAQKKTIKSCQTIDKFIVVTYTLQIFNHHMQGYGLYFLTDIIRWHWVKTRAWSKIMHANAVLRLMHIIRWLANKRWTIPQASFSVNTTRSKIVALFHYRNEGLQRFSYTIAHHWAVVIEVNHGQHPAIRVLHHLKNL